MYFERCYFNSVAEDCEGGVEGIVDLIGGLYVAEAP